LIGLPLGYALQRSQLCFNRAYRELQLFGQAALVRMIGLAVLVQMIGLALLIQFNVAGVQTNVVPFWWLGPSGAVSPLASRWSMHRAARARFGTAQAPEIWAR
jgi:hypothetical protein